MFLFVFARTINIQQEESKHCTKNAWTKVSLRNEKKKIRNNKNKTKTKTKRNIKKKRKKYSETQERWFVGQKILSSCNQIKAHQNVHQDHYIPRNATFTNLGLERRFKTQQQDNLYQIL